MPKSRTPAGTGGPPAALGRRPPPVAPSTVALLAAGGAVRDRDFDLVYPTELRRVSFQHWTPVGIALRAARLLVGAGATHVADIGAGAGKFCIVGALATPARFTGIEQRAHLVSAARAAAWRFGAKRARFLHTNLTRAKLEAFDGFYLYNPFHEQICSTLPPIDTELDLSPLLYREYVICVMDTLRRARAGTAVVTYHGFGGSMPATYRRVHQEEAGNDRLVLWVKSSRRSLASKRPLAGRKPPHSADER